MMSAIPFEADQELHLAVRREECDDSSYLLILWSSPIIHEDVEARKPPLTRTGGIACMTFTVSENGKSIPTSISASVLGVRKRNKTLLVAFDLPMQKASKKCPYVISIDFFICICSQRKFVLLKYILRR